MSANPFRPMKNVPSGTVPQPSKDGPLPSVLKRELPNFELAPLSEFSVETFNSKNPEVDRFVLTLALAFNDLKSFEWNYSFLTEAAPTERVVDAQAGQVFGMRVWISRFTIALVHELLLAIKGAVDEGVTAHPQFEAALSRLPARGQELWAQLVRVATDRPDTELMTWFVQVRGNLAYHYGQPKPLLAGYKRAFFTDPKVATNRAIYASFGRNMNESRLFFADAAAARAYGEDRERVQELMNRTGELRSLVNRALVAVTHAYLAHRHEELQGGGK